MEGSWNYSRCRTCCSVTLHCVSLNCVALHWLAYHDPEMISTSRPTSTAHVTHSVGRSDWNPTTVISSLLAQSIGNEDVKLKCYVSAMPVLSGVLKMSCCTEFQRSECERLRQGWGRLPGDEGSIAFRQAPRANHRSPDGDAKVARRGIHPPLFPPSLLHFATLPILSWHEHILCKYAKHTEIGFYSNLSIDIQKTITI